MTTADPIYGPDELADRAGVSRRTVRYYVQRGLLDAPTGLGRGKHYTEAHLARLLRIRELQEAGVPLEEIAARLDGRIKPAVLQAEPEQSSWTRLVLADGVEVHLRSARFSEAQVRALSLAIKRTMGAQEP